MMGLKMESWVLEDEDNTGGEQEGNRIIVGESVKEGENSWIRKSSCILGEEK